MGHHGHQHHGHRHQEQRYGAYPGSYSGSYVASSAYAPQAPAYGYDQQLSYGGYGAAQPSYGGAIQAYPQNGMNELYAQEQKHKRNEHRAEAVALGAAAFAAYEHHEVKVDPEHAARHRREEHIAEAVAVGAGGYALYEHQQVQHDHQQLQAAGYYPEHGRKHEKKHRHGLFH